MATRPIFFPKPNSDLLFGRVDLSIIWHGGFSVSQKQKNISELHKVAHNYGFKDVLEISSKSDHEIGRRLSAFSLVLNVNDKKIPLESAYQGSKVFKNGGPYQDMYDKSPIDCKRDERLKNSGNIISFRLFDEEYPSQPLNLFYDWIYISALAEHEEFLKEKLSNYDGFTDIEFNPDKSVNCQARALAIMMALINSNELQEVMANFDNFERKLNGAFSMI